MGLVCPVTGALIISKLPAIASPGDPPVFGLVGLLSFAICPLITLGALDRLAGYPAPLTFDTPFVCHMYCKASLSFVRAQGGWIHDAFPSV